MKKNDLEKKIAKLESINDQLISEITNLDQMAKKLGFVEGIKTLKSAARELLKEQQKAQDDFENEKE